MKVEVKEVENEGFKIHFDNDKTSYVYNKHNIERIINEYNLQKKDIFITNKTGVICTDMFY